MRRAILGCSVFLLLLASFSLAQGKPAAKPAASAAKVFPYPVITKTLPNGLKVTVVPAHEFKDAATFASVVMAGSRNEVHKGKTGLAHLFEHIMFRHEWGGKPSGYDNEIARMGVDNNAFTDYDITFYHPTTFTENLFAQKGPNGERLPGVIELEAARFKGLKLDQKTFQVEAGAVLGEYRRIFSFPEEKMIEDLSPVAFPNHPYGHTVIGYRDDVEKMPEAWDVAWEFYRNYYTPASVGILVVGDVEPDRIFAEVEKYYSDWKAVTPPAIPPEQEPDGEKTVHVKWDSDVSPKLMVGYHTPAFKPGTKEAAIGILLSELLTSRSAPLFQKLRYQKQSATSFGMYSQPDSTDPHWLLVSADLVQERFQKDGDKYVQEVRQDIIDGIEALQHFSKEKGAAKTLAVLKSKVKNDFLAGMNNTLSTATVMGYYYRYEQDPKAIDKTFAGLQTLTPADIDAYARKYFTEKRRVTATLWKDAAAAETKKEGN
ncbi:MAG TPA: pitrilysin family protein [Terriglobales bacterium]|nr:pitrilysin family protein [Terriglobales bacterium]